MAWDERTAQAQLTPEERRALLRAFADRMLLKITAMDDPADMPGVERAVRVAAVIERVYSRCDRAERQTRIEAPDLFKAEAECATHQTAAIEARVVLANTLKWEEARRRDLGHWWEAAQSATEKQTPISQVSVSHVSTSPAPASARSAYPERLAEADPETPDALSDTDTTSDTSDVIYTDYTEDILEAQAELAKRKNHSPAHTEPTRVEHTKKPPAPA